MGVKTFRGCAGFPLFFVAILTTSVGVHAQTECPDVNTMTQRGFIDLDNDEVSDGIDNCKLVANADQRDSNGDGFGNMCDPDLDNNGIVNFVDFNMLGNLLLSSDEDADLNGDGVVNFLDISIAGNYFLSQPGPNGRCLNDPSYCAGPATFGFDDDADLGVPTVNVQFVAHEQEVIYHARQIADGSSICNTSLRGDVFAGTAGNFPVWDWHMEGPYYFAERGGFTEVCDASASWIQSQLIMLCATNSLAAVFCFDWCPFGSRILTEQ